MNPIQPFRYPQTPLRRKHGPQGYSQYRHYRPWLRDEFDFRCVYCLKRELWCSHDGDHELDHQVAQSTAPELCREYTNLVYACANCNHRKGARHLPAPDQVAYGACLEVLRDGRIIPCDESGDGERLIDELALDAKRITAYRARWIRSLYSHQLHDWSLFLLWMGFPDDLPDLENVQPPPKQNTRPNGIKESWLKVSRPSYFE